MTSFPPGGTAKVAIPRLPRPHLPPGDEAGAGGKGKHRVPIACRNCHARKVKCTGEIPRCSNCEASGLECEYAPSRKARLRESTEINIALIDLLNQLAQSPDTQPDEVEHIRHILSEAGPAVVANARKFDIRWRLPELAQSALPGEAAGEALASGSVGSNEDGDQLDEDLFASDDARAAGYVGKAAAAQWMRGLQQEPSQKTLGPPGPSDEARGHRIDAAQSRVASRGRSNKKMSVGSALFLEPEDVPVADSVDPWALPPPERVFDLIGYYMSNGLQTTYPIISKHVFMQEVHAFLSGQQMGTASNVSNEWLAMLNLVLAIGALYERLIGAREASAQSCNHQTYFSRAYKLSPQASHLFHHANVSTTQMLGLFALYYLCIGQRNRAWISIGLAIRFAHALGMHVRNEVESISPTDRERYSRIWWGFYCLERTLCTITGRPSGVVDNRCSVPLPLPIPDDQLSDKAIKSLLSDRLKETHINPMASLSRRARDFKKETTEPPERTESSLQILSVMGSVLGEIQSQLYTPGSMQEPWAKVQDAIFHTTKLLDRWLRSLPPWLDIDVPSTNADHLVERNVLTFQYLSAKMLATRPCLCRLQRRIEHQSSPSAEFDAQTARDCVGAAKKMVYFVSGAWGPDQPPDPTQLYTVGPWWAIIHYLTQAAAVLLLSLSCRDENRVENKQTVGEHLKQLLRWFRAMSPDSPVAKKAYNLTMKNARILGREGTLDLSEILAEDDFIEFSNASNQQYLYYYGGGGPGKSSREALDPTFGSTRPPPFDADLAALNYSQPSTSMDYYGTMMFNNDFFWTAYDLTSPSQPLQPSAPGYSASGAVAPSFESAEEQIPDYSDEFPQN